MKPRTFKPILIIFLLIWHIDSYAQDSLKGVIFHIQSSHTAFPDTGREKGHMYDKVLYTATDHYHDSSVLIVAPKKLDAKKSVDLIFWFHGWRNNIDNAANFYELTRQFLASNTNAVLVLAETAKDSPDSYGGKLENPGVFKALTTDVLSGLKSQHLISKGCKPGHVLLAGHSGAYRVMARIIKNGQMPIDETVLFDALYAETPIFLDWIKADQNHRFIDLYTDHGGTDEETHNLVKLIAQEKIPYLESEEGNVNFQAVKDNRILIIHSLHEHNNVINKPDNFQLFLENSPFLKALQN
ncbi:MAG TPA: hypothetical protein VL442_02360 [Mucilaginibacter sp.]|nr:hypothetical protein [Mucilaginibacter sp.]